MMADNRNEFHIVAFDPGGVIGWTHLVIHKRAFVTPQAKVLKNILRWNTGEFNKSEYDNIHTAVRLMRYARYYPMPFNADCNFISEDFELTQLIGGEDLLSPVRINAILGWECLKNTGLNLQLQKRTLRTSVTKQRLQLWKLWPVKGKDSFASMQHAVTWMRRVKIKANERPWKLKEE